MTSIPSADGKTVFVEAGIVALRDEKGGFRDPRVLYLAADKSEITASGLLQSEQEQITDISHVLAQMFSQYMDGIKAIERHQRKEKQIEPLSL